MAIALPVMGVTFIAICVYALSYGLWLRYYAWGSHGNATLDACGFYLPLLRFTTDGPKWLAAPYNAYLKWVISVGVL